MFFHFLRHLVKNTFGAFFYWGSLMFLGIALSYGLPLLRESTGIIVLVTFIAGLIFFRSFRFTRFYVLGHELTHYLVAKLFLKHTGRIRLAANKGSVEVVDPNFIITLSPYFLPFYFLFFLLIFGIVEFFLCPLPREMVWGAAWLFGFSYAYHCLMTIVVLQKEQSDITTYGAFFSYGLIVAGNALFLLLSALVLTGRWLGAWQLLVQLVRIQLSAVVEMFRLLF